MKIEDIHINFGRSVLIEKSYNTGFLEMVDYFVNQEEENTFFHAHLSGTGWVTIVHYSPKKLDENFFNVRLLFLKQVEPDKNIKYDKDHLINTTKNTLIRFTGSGSYFVATDVHPIHQQQLNHKIALIDSSLVYCHKEFVAVLIKEIHDRIISEFQFYNSQHGLNGYANLPLREINIPHTFVDMSDYNKTFNNPLHALRKDYNAWATKHKRKGRRLLKKSITLNPL